MGWFCTCKLIQKYHTHLHSLFILNSFNLDQIGGYQCKINNANHRIVEVIISYSDLIWQGIIWYYCLNTENFQTETISLEHNYTSPAIKTETDSQFCKQTWPSISLQGLIYDVECLSFMSVSLLSIVPGLSPQKSKFVKSDFGSVCSNGAFNVGLKIHSTSDLYFNPCMAWVKASIIWYRVGSEQFFVHLQCWGWRDQQPWNSHLGFSSKWQQETYNSHYSYNISTYSSLHPPPQVVNMTRLASYIGRAPDTGESEFKKLINVRCCM